MDDDHDDQQQSLLTSRQKPEAYRFQERRRILSYCAISTSIIFNVIFMVLLAVTLHRSSGASSETGFKSELSLATKHISLIQKPFFGGIHLDGQGHFATDQTESKYVGKPSKALDNEWKQLLKGLNLDLHADELEDPESTFRWPESGMYLSGLEVYHSLHCLNRLRQAIYIDHYKYIFSRPDDPAFLDHVDHCINHIRQALQCQSDLTPMEWKLEGNKVILKTDTMHTCRDWTKIHEWASSRQTDFDAIESYKNKTLILVD